MDLNDYNIEGNVVDMCILWHQEILQSTSCRIVLEVPQRDEYIGGLDWVCDRSVIDGNEVSRSPEVRMGPILPCRCQ